MAKLRDTPITSKDIKEYLNTQDNFDLELYVYRIAKEIGLKATHGGSYEDPVTKKTRQYDVRVASENKNFRIDLAIECKSLHTSYPLLISRIPRATDESFHELIFAHKPEENNYGLVNPVIEDGEVIPVKPPDSIYKTGYMVGKATAQIGKNENGEFKSDDSEVFDKWSQALASADDLVSNASTAHSISEVDKFLTFVMPVLVISDDTLWVADYSKEGYLEKEPYKVDETTLFVEKIYGQPLQSSYTISHLHVCTRSKVKSFLKNFQVGKSMWKNIFPRDIVIKLRLI